jgi:prepilin-type N-terminal cleavage/methylation domain-containing protein
MLTLTNKILLSRRNNKRGFTIVELLIVIVVIAILASITIVSFNGISKRAIMATLSSDLSSSNEAILLYEFDSNNNSYPTSLSLLNDGVGIRASGDNTFGYAYDNTSTPKTFCVTAFNLKTTPRSINQDGLYSDDACPGAAGGLGYCPESSSIALNGYYCDGTVGSTASLNSPATKQLATTSGVPAGAPGYYVGSQTSRDNLIGSTFNVTAGDVYCIDGWAATSTSGVTHTIGLMYTGSSTLATTWRGVNAAVSSGATWKKLSGCLTVPSTYTRATFWTQNDGSNGTTANPAWYQTALMIRKQ